MKQIWVPDLSIISRWIYSKIGHRLLDIIIIGLLIYAVFMRNVSIQVCIDSQEWALTNSGARLPVHLTQAKIPGSDFLHLKTENKIYPPSGNVKTIPTEKKQITGSKPTQEKKAGTSTMKKDNAANHFSNVTFILNSALIIKSPANIVGEKMKICELYARRYSNIAQAEMEKYGIPASITLAQGILESDAAGSKLSKNNKNHFGVKCFSRRCKNGHCSNFTDDTHKDFFKIYRNVWESYRDHSFFLQNARYKHLKKLGKSDYKSWAHGLKKAGYATDKKYAEKLILIIETLKLNQYDKG